jgi:23S rRNA maturation-related 3'-5' exoribonuclease YhaM
MIEIMMLKHLLLSHVGGRQIGTSGRGNMWLIEIRRHWVK